MGRMMIYHYVRWCNEKDIEAYVVHSSSDKSLFPDITNAVLRIPFFGENVSVRRRLKYFIKTSHNPFVKNRYLNLLRNSVFFIPETFLTKRNLLQDIRKNQRVLLVQSPHYLVLGMNSRIEFQFVLSVAPANTNYVEFIFDVCQIKSADVVCHNIDYNLLDMGLGKTSSKIKITYMPRRGKEDLEGVLKLYKLKGKYNDIVSFVPIDNVTKDAAYKCFQSSHIFLTFSLREGLGMPVIEAAIFRNYIVGFHGWGCEHLFEKFNTFYSVDPGNWIDAILILDMLIAKILNSHCIDSQVLTENARKIFNQFSEKNVKRNFIKLIEEDSFHTFI